MSTIVTRAGKGSALTHTEMDSNLTNLNSDKVEGPSSSVDNELALFNSTTGKLVKRATQTGILTATSGVIGTAVSGTDIKTINGASILGSGDVTVSGGITTGKAIAMAMIFGG